MERNAFKGAKTAEHLEKFLVRGGRILMFEQDDSTRFGYHARERRLEHAFIAATDSAIAEGLQNEDLSFWRGRAESVANEVVPHPVYQYGIAPGAAVPHLTNRNLVAGRTVELPSYGNFRPLITGGYDRAEAVVLEARSGRGRLLLCMADVTSRYGIDPAATLLADNLLREFAKTPSALLPGVRYSGDDTGKEFLSSLGIAINPASSVGVLGKGGTLARLGDVSTVVRLPFSGTLADAVNAKSFELWCSTWPRYWNGQFSGTLELLKDLRPGTDFPASAGHVFSGLSACDFYFFELPELESLRFKEAVSDVKTTPNGLAGEGFYQGRRLIVCGVDPARIRSGEARGKALRIWSVLFSNLNIENAFRIRFSDSPLDLSRRRWTFATDPKGDGEARGFADGKCPKEKLRKIIPGIIWEAQGVTERNPELPNNAPGSAYDGWAWYFTTVRFPEAPKGKFYFHVNGLRDIPTFQRTEQQSDLYVNRSESTTAISAAPVRGSGSLTRTGCSKRVKTASLCESTTPRVPEESTNSRSVWNGRGKTSTSCFRTSSDVQNTQTISSGAGNDRCKTDRSRSPQGERLSGGVPGKPSRKRLFLLFHNQWNGFAGGTGPDPCGLRI